MNWRNQRKICIQIHKGAKVKMVGTSKQNGGGGENSDEDYGMETHRNEILWMSKK